MRKQTRTASVRVDEWWQVTISLCLSAVPLGTFLFSVYVCVVHFIVGHGYNVTRAQDRIVDIGNHFVTSA